MTEQNCSFTTSFLVKQRARIQSRINKYLDPNRIGDELLSGDVSPYTKHKQTVMIPILNKAINRLDTGEYGICLTCGQPIEEERLERVPAAEDCMSCMK